jgi:threonine synthase
MLRVFVANGVKEVVQDLRGDAEHAARVSLSIQSGEAASLERALKAGEVFDVATLSAWTVDELVIPRRAARRSAQGTRERTTQTLRESE